jgi:hypothetical protein
MMWVSEAGVPELPRLARTIDSWRVELLAYYSDTGGVSNGPASQSTAEQENQARPSRIPQPPQLLGPPVTPPRSPVEHSRRRPDQRWRTTIRCVEPVSYCNQLTPIPPLRRKCH